MNYTLKNDCIESHRLEALIYITLSYRWNVQSMTYLISQGIIKDRILQKVLVSQIDFNKCDNNLKCTDEQHAVNRRSTLL
jgi:hypothetical protein